MDVKEKITKLLRLFESDNENEAMAALLKAHELMAKHKIEEYEIDKNADNRSKELHKVRTGIYFSKQWNPFLREISSIIGDFLCAELFVQENGENIIVKFAL